MTRQTRRRSPASIITTFSTPQRLARSSVWPGKSYPAARIAALLMGAVTIAAASPERHRAQAHSTYSAMARPQASVGRPYCSSCGGQLGERPHRQGTAADGKLVGRHPRFPVKRAHPAPKTAAARSSTPTSPATRRGRSRPSSRPARRALRMTSGPTPVGSPMVMTIGLFNLYPPEMQKLSLPYRPEAWQQQSQHRNFFRPACLPFFFT